MNEGRYQQSVDTAVPGEQLLSVPGPLLSLRLLELLTSGSQVSN